MAKSSTTTILILVAVAGAAFAGYWFFIRPRNMKPGSSVQAAQRPPTATPTKNVKPLPPVKSSTGSMLKSAIGKGASTACAAAGGGAACNVALPILGSAASKAGSLALSGVKKLKFW